MARQSSDDFFTPIVSFHEQVQGWNAYLARAKSPVGLAKGYSRLEKILTDFSQSRVASFDDDAALQFELLRSQRIRIGTMDLRIAAIALVRAYTVLSRNLVDFQKVPGFTAEDWTKP